MKSRQPPATRKILLTASLVVLASLCVAGASTHNTTSDSSDVELVPGSLKVTKDNTFEAPALFGDDKFTLQTDPVTGEVDFKTKTLNISLINREQEQATKDKVTVIQKDLQSRIQIADDAKDQESADADISIETTKEESEEKEAKVKEDIESRIIQENKKYRLEHEEYPIKRADVDYYEENLPVQSRISDEEYMAPPKDAAKEEESFFSIFESLFGAGEEENKPTRDTPTPLHKDNGGYTFREDINHMKEILNPHRKQDTVGNGADYAPEYRTPIQNVRPDYGSHANYHQSYHKPPLDRYQAIHRPKPTYSPHRPHPHQQPQPIMVNEDYDLEEFMDRNDTPPPPLHHRQPTANTPPKPTPDTIRNEIVQEGKIRQPPPPPTPASTEAATTVTATPTNPPTTTASTTTTTTTEKRYFAKPDDYETKTNEVKPANIHDSANFYNFINLPVHYSNKDTAIPLISGSYANTKIQGMSASKYDKMGGKHPNHKYDPIATSTKRPHYWPRRTTSSPGPGSQRTTIQAARPTADLSRFDYEDVAIGSGADFGGYGNKEGVDTTTAAATPISTTRRDEAPVPTTQRQEITRFTTRREEMTRPTTRPTTRRDEVTKHTTIRQEVTRPTIRQEGTRPTTTRQEVTILTIQKHDPTTTTTRRTELLKPATSRTPDTNKYNPPSKPVMESTEDYEDDGYPAEVHQVKPWRDQKPMGSNVYETVEKTTSKASPSAASAGSTIAKSTTEPAEYEYYEYDAEQPVTTTTQKYRVRYPNLPKDRLQTSTEKVAVVVPTKIEEVETKLHISSSTSTTTTTTSTTTSRPIEVDKEEGPYFPHDGLTSSEENSLGIYRPFPDVEDQPQHPLYHETLHHPSDKPVRPPIKKPPAPVFESEEEETHATQKVTTTTHKIKPIIVTAAPKEPVNENNVNIVLVPAATGAGQRPHSEEDREEQPIRGAHDKPWHQQPNRPSFPPKRHGPHQGHQDHTTEFTVGVVQGHGGGEMQVQGHFVASSISASPFGSDDEPFRPIPRPPGMSASFQVADDDELGGGPENRPAVPAAPLPLPSPPHLQEADSTHQPHEFIPSPQFHRPDHKPRPEPRPQQENLDYDLSEIQTEPKPGQYVIFSKPQLNPEINENQLKKKPDTNKLIIAEGLGQHGEDPAYKKPILYHPKPGMFEEKLEVARPERPSIELVPHGPRPPQLSLIKGSQTEKPFELPFGPPETTKQPVDSAANYPRPHWEKNGKPSFLVNSRPNDLRQPTIPPQMIPNLIPPSSGVPQRFRKPVPPNMPPNIPPNMPPNMPPNIGPNRKNFNEGHVGHIPKSNLPNILPQFRPNAKIGGPHQRPYHRPNSYPNRRTGPGPNRYIEKDGNFPYHIQPPGDKEAMLHRDFEMQSGDDIIPKFISHRGKLPIEGSEQYAVQKRYGVSPMNVHTPREGEHVGLVPPDIKVLKRLQRTPVTTLQMLQQKPGLKTHKTPVTREDNADPSAPLVPPVYKTYQEDKNLFVVYPTKSEPQFKADARPNVKIEDPDKFPLNFNLSHNQVPLLKPTKKFERPDFPYGFVRPDEKLKLVRKQQVTVAETSGEMPGDKEVKPNLQDYMPFVTKPLPPSDSNNDRIDMNIHLQSNNQWNTVSGVDSPAQEQYSPELPSAYQASLKEDNSAFTLGAMMHTVQEVEGGKKRGQVLNGEEDLVMPTLNVNERVSNGKIVKVSMPLDVKEEPQEQRPPPIHTLPNSMDEKYDFQAPFQASSSIHDTEPLNQGWRLVKDQLQTSEAEDRHQTQEPAQNETAFNIENFKPQLIGGFKPIYEVPEDELSPVVRDSEEHTLR